MFKGNHASLSKHFCRMLCNIKHNAYILSYIVGFCKTVRYIFDKNHKKFNTYYFGMKPLAITDIF